MSQHATHKNTKRKKQTKLNQLNLPNKQISK